MSDVFVSYAREDLAAGQALAELLTASGLTVFWDQTIRTGAEWEELIEAELARAAAVVVLWSEHSVASAWVRAEAAEAAERGTLMPAVLDEARPPLRHRGAQTANLREWRPGEAHPGVERFVEDVVTTVRRSREAGSGEASASLASGSGRAEREPGTASPPAELATRAIPWLVTSSLLFAWVGSLALALTLAHDFGVIGGELGRDLFRASYPTTLGALLAGGATSALLGAVSLRSRFVKGVLQGWVWPISAALAQLLLLIAIYRLVPALPFVGEFESLAMAVLGGSIGPGALTVAGVATLRSAAARL